MSLEIFFYIFSFLLGLGVGSFLNVLTIRFRPEENFSIWQSLKGRSKCSYCQKNLKWFELIPLLSFILQKGKCRSCGASLSWQYPIVELLTGFLFLLVAWHWFGIFGSVLFCKAVFYSVIWWIYFSLFLALTIIDLKFFLIPQVLLDIFFGLALFLNLLFTFNFLKAPPSFIGYYTNIFPKSGVFILDSLIGALVFAGFLWLLVKTTKEKAVGMGDVKMFFVLSFIFPWPDIILVFFLSFLFGAIFSLFAMLLKKKGFKSKVPFVPFIFLAVLVVFLFGFPLLKLYFSLIKFL